MLGTRNPNHYNAEKPGEAFLVGVEPVENIEPVKAVENVKKEKEVKEVKEEPVISNDEGLKSEDLYDLTKTEQIELLKEFGLTDKEIKKIKYESDRVNKILELNG